MSSPAQEPTDTLTHGTVLLCIGWRLDGQSSWDFVSVLLVEVNKSFDLMGQFCSLRIMFSTGPACSQQQPQDLASCPDLPTFNAAPPSMAVSLPLEADPPPVLGVSGPAAAPTMSLPSIGMPTPSLASLVSASPTGGAGTCTCAQGQGSSTCPAGWNGANCDSCLTDDVCRVKTEDPEATCNKKFPFTE